MKASENPNRSILTGLKSFKQIAPKAKLYCVCTAPRKRVLEDIIILPWQEIFSTIGIE